MKTKCCVKRCVQPIHIKKHGLCKPHVMRLYRLGEPGSAKIRPIKLKQKSKTKK